MIYIFQFSTNITFLRNLKSLYIQTIRQLDNNYSSEVFFFGAVFFFAAGFGVFASSVFFSDSSLTASAFSVGSAATSSSKFNRLSSNNVLYHDTSFFRSET